MFKTLIQGPCPLCNAAMDKVIFFGLPGKLCQNAGCTLLIGLAAYAPAIETADGNGFAFYVYQGSYWRALWHCIIGKVPHE